MRADAVLRDTARFYDLLSALGDMPLQGASLASVIAEGRLPQRGVYFFRSNNPHSAEAGDGARRVTRIGTHAVSAGSKSTLRARLRAHLGPKSGGGNHRGSIFRLHVGNAILRMDSQSLPTWGVGSVAPQALKDSTAGLEAEAALEQRVSQLIGAMPVLWLDVPDEAGPMSERALIERGAIALLSNNLDPLEQPTSNWLGRHSTRHEIRASGLWNLRHVNEGSDPTFLDAMERAVSRTLSDKARKAL